MTEKIVLASVLAILCMGFTSAHAEDGTDEKRAQARTLMQESNIKEAAALFRGLALDRAVPPVYATGDFQSAVTCYQHIGLQAEGEALLQEVIATRSDSWRMLLWAAKMRVQYPSNAGLSERRYQNSQERDRVAALQLFLKAESILNAPEDPADAADKANFFMEFETALRTGREDRLAWRLTALTDLESLPDFEEQSSFWSRPRRGAPVDDVGDPIYYHTPDSWDAARNDGERWRWVLARLATEGGGSGRVLADWQLGTFLLSQFGVHTMTMDSPLSRDADIAGKTGPFAVRTLSENETIARLANGLKRFTMPEEFNHIKILRRVSEVDSGFPMKLALFQRANRSATLSLAHIFENRQQYNKAVSFYELARQRFDDDSRMVNDALARITGKNGQIETGPVAPAGQRTTLSYLFRNGSRVNMAAKRLDEKKLLGVIRAQMKSDLDKLPYGMRRPEMIGRMALEEGGDKYVAETVAQWQVDLRPLPDYYSSRTNIELPFDKAGCYLIEANMEGGNTSRVVLWVADLALVRKSMGDRHLLYVADAVTGAPVPDATVTLSGIGNNPYASKNREFVSDEFAERTDAQGMAFVPSSRLDNKEWLIIAEAGDGRFAYQGFDHIWTAQWGERPAHSKNAFIITDRPVYRPGQGVNFKIWLGDASYVAKPDAGELGGRSVTLRIVNPRGDMIYTKTLTTDAYGGAADKIVLDGDAPLGQYTVYTNEYGGVGFRLEEYKKPEFEVSVDTPDKALPLGDSAQVTVRAKYYYGAPVTDGKVTYKIVRTTFTQTWTPPWRWDWLYGSGAWRSSYDYSWYPGWNTWSCIGPRPPWMPFTYEQPEVVAEGEGELDTDGVFRVALDTAPAKELFGDKGHSYAVTVEVTDRSRRTIVGSGKVVASRKPFDVAVWTDRGYYSSGQEMRVDYRALLPLGGGVKTAGKATLYRISYDDKGTPSETETGSWDLATDAQGSGSLRLSADQPGQYRVACRLRDDNGRKAEGAALITVRGATGAGDFRFSALELVPDRQDYRPGDVVKLAINSANKDAAILFLARAERNGRTTVSKNSDASLVVIRLDNGSHVAEIPVGTEDQPNLFCEAITVFDGRIYSETREIFVPPADKTLSVKVTADKDSYAPGARAEFSVKVVDVDGKPMAGQCVVSLYDKSVEYISGGSNIGDIRSHFWSWKRHYGSQVTSSLSKFPYPVEKNGDVRWEPIGIFGAQEADWNDEFVHTNGRMPRARMQAGGMVSAYAQRDDSYSGMAFAEAPMPPMAAAPMAKMESASVDTIALEADYSNEAAPVSGGGEAGAMVEVVVRSEFADTALWIAALETDADGRATFSLDMPENLTAWKARTWVMAPGTRVGDGQKEVETRKNVIVRPQTPRFLTQKDQVILSANLHNYLPRAKSARAELVLEGGLLEPADGVELVRTLTLAANGEERVDWLVNARRPGEARVVMKLLTDEESDAAEMTIPVIVHGARKVENFGGVVRGSETEASIRFRVPEERLPDQSRLELTFSPTIASSMLEALPYLIEYPYGCTEQTLNRFLPVVMTRKFLDRMGVTLSDAGRIGANVPVDPKSEEWKKKWGDPRSDIKRSPVFDDAELTAMVKLGVERLTAMQNSDGGWGWFSGSGERSWPHTTAVVVHGLLTARDNGAAIPTDVVERGIGWLRSYRDKEIARLQSDPKDKEWVDRHKASADNLDAFVYMILAGQGNFHADMRDLLYRDRLNLSLSGLSMLGLALHSEEATNALDMVRRNLEQSLDRDAENGTAWLRAATGSGWWWWYNDSIETQAWYLKLLSRLDPSGADASGVAKYLLRNRKNGAYWRSTRDTAYAIEALSEFASASGEAAPDMTVTVLLDGKQVMQRTLKAADILADNRFVLEGLAVETGEHELRLVRSGTGNLYYGGGLDLFSLEDPIAKAGFELKVDRSFYKLIREEKFVDMYSSRGMAISRKVENYRRERLPSPFDGDGAAAVPLASGDLVEVELTIEAKNDYEYLVFEDMKAAGCEAVELQSGYTANRPGAYVEYRDQKVVLFVRYLPKGVYTISYRFRAEIPGSFSALPTFGGGMYATDLFANSDEMKVKIVEEGVYGE